LHWLQSVLLRAQKRKQYATDTRMGQGVPEVRESKSRESDDGGEGNYIPFEYLAQFYKENLK